MHHRGEFGTDLGVVLSYIKASVDKKELKNLISSDERFKCFDREAFDVIHDATDSKLRVIEKEGKIDVYIRQLKRLEKKDVRKAI